MGFTTKQKTPVMRPEDLSDLQVLFRLILAIILVGIIYLVPSYSFMFKPISDHVGIVLRFLGIPFGSIVGLGGYYGFEVNGEYYYIVKACTGMQAGAILISLILVTPSGQNAVRKKFLAGSVLFISLYIGNVLRIAFHMLLLSRGIPFSIAHDMLSKPIGFVGTILFALAIERIGVPILDQFSLFFETLWAKGKTLLGIKSTQEATSSQIDNPNTDQE
jgi:exosortase/archaeosortase family protein